MRRFKAVFLECAQVYAGAQYLQSLNVLQGDAFGQAVELISLQMQVVEPPVQIFFGKDLIITKLSAPGRL